MQLFQSPQLLHQGILLRQQRLCRLVRWLFLLVPRPLLLLLLLPLVLPLPVLLLPTLLLLSLLLILLLSLPLLMRLLLLPKGSDWNWMQIHSMANNADCQ